MFNVISKYQTLQLHIKSCKKIAIITNIIATQKHLRLYEKMQGFIKKIVKINVQI